MLAALAKHGKPLSRAELEAIVATNDEKRFAFNDNGTLILASQGHSVEVELGYQPAMPPALLYHGTIERFLESIRARGLLRGERHHVHLSADDETAQRVGARRGKPVVLIVDATAMVSAAHFFYRSENGVWLTEHVPAQFIRFPD
ncbi:MAG: RNA 2'-phosphotransferase [Aestuariivirga sp.]